METSTTAPVRLGEKEIRIVIWYIRSLKIIKMKSINN
jgi:hypothetical protein